MFSNFFTLLQIAESLHDRLKTSTIEDVFSQERGVLAISFHGLPDRLIVSCLSEASTCYLHNRYARARRNSVDLFPSAVGETVGAVSIHPCDRVVTLQFISGRRFILQFFGARSNIFLVNTEGSIEDAFKNGRQFLGSTYIAPPGVTLPSLHAIRASFAHHAGATVMDALRSAIPSLGPILSTETVYRTGIPGTTLVSEGDNHTTDLLLATLHEILDELHHPQPRIYFSESDSPILFSLVSLRHLGRVREEFFDDIHIAIQRILARKRSVHSLRTTQTELRIRLESLRTKAKRSLTALERELHEHDRATLYQQYGSFLLTHASDISKGTTCLSIPSESEPIQIPLDPALTPNQNAQRYFDKAKHARRSRENAQARMRMLERRQSVIAGLLLSLESATSREELDQFMNTQKDKLDSLGIGPSQAMREELPFRTFVVDGGFEVWAGKDNTNNDLLTLKYARPNDLWFHARGVSGSHIVLRVATGKGPPGKKAKEQAAGIAAYYSKMRKASMVPVTMTERKYIRKPKGAPPGTVMVSREETVFATPGLPPSAAGGKENE